MTGAPPRLRLLDAPSPALKASPQTGFPVQMLRIGEVCIGTSPCETFAETGVVAVMVLVDGRWLLDDGGLEPQACE